TATPAAVPPARASGRAPPPRGRPRSPGWCAFGAGRARGARRGGSRPRRPPLAPLLCVNRVGCGPRRDGPVTRVLGSNRRPVPSRPLTTMHGIADENGFREYPPVWDRTVGTGADLEFSGRTAGIDSQIAYTALPVCVNRRRPVAG